MNPTSIDHLGYSRVGCLLDCPAKFKFNYVEGIRTKGKAVLRRGNAYHGTLEELLKYKMETGKLMPPKKADKIAVKQGKKFELTDNQIYEVIDAMRFYYDELYSKHRPIAVEDSFDIVRAGVRITGRIDLIEEDGYIIDHKFSNDIWSEDRASKGSQPIIYQWAGDDFLKDRYGISYKGFKYNIIRLFPAPAIQEVTIDRISESDSEWWEEQLIQLIGAMRAGYYPANPTIRNKQVCKYCDYKKLCKPRTYKPKVHMINDTSLDDVRDTD